MNENVLIEIIKTSLSIIGTVIGAVIVYQLIDFRRKQRLDTFWRIEKEYKSDYRRDGRILLSLVEKEFSKKISELQHLDLHENQIEIELSNYYNSNWHNSPDENIKENARKMRHRIREHHEYGILLRKGMVDKDLLFSLIGLSFEIDYAPMNIILKAIRGYHNTPYMYNHFEYLWENYNKWKRISKLMK